MNKDEKAAVVEEVAAQIQESEAVFAVDYRGIACRRRPSCATRLGEAGASCASSRTRSPAAPPSRPAPRTSRSCSRGRRRSRSCGRRRRACRQGDRHLPPRARRARVQGRPHGRRDGLGRADPGDRLAPPPSARRSCRLSPARSSGWCVASPLTGPRAARQIGTGLVAGPRARSSRRPRQERSRGERRGGLRPRRRLRRAGEEARPRSRRGAREEPPPRSTGHRSCLTTKRREANDTPSEGEETKEG